MAGIQSDAMRDVSVLAKKLVSLKNRLTGIVMTKEGVNNFDHWTNMVRYADAHQEEYEFGYAEKLPSEQALEDEDESEIGPDGGEKITMKWLKKQHYKTLQKKAKELGLDHTGTQAELVDRIFQAV